MKLVVGERKVVLLRCQTLIHRRRRCSIDIWTDARIDSPPKRFPASRPHKKCPAACRLDVSENRENNRPATVKIIFAEKCSSRKSVSKESTPSTIIGGGVVKSRPSGAFHVLAGARIDLNLFAFLDEKWRLNVDPCLHLDGFHHVIG